MAKIIESFRKPKIEYPAFNCMDYNVSLLKNLQFYNLEIQDDKLKKSWAIKYWDKQGKQCKEISRIGDSYFTTVGAVAHMASERDIALDDQHLMYLNLKYDELLLMIAAVPKSEQSSPQGYSKTKEELDDDIISSHIAEFEYILDSFVTNLLAGSDVKISDVKSYLIRNNVKPGIAKKIAEWFKLKLVDIKAAYDGKDEQLVESYEFLSRRQQKKYIEFIQSMIASCEVASAIQRESKKPRQKKEIPASELVKNVKYLAEDTYAKLKSEHPTKIIGSTEIWLYCPKIRRIFRCVALQGMKFTISGTTIQHLDQEQSGGKIVRKPDAQLAGIQSMNKSSINKIYDDIRGTKSRATGRMNDDTIIVRCF